MTNAAPCLSTLDNSSISCALVSDYASARIDGPTCNAVVYFRCREPRREKAAKSNSASQRLTLNKTIAES